MNKFWLTKLMIVPPVLAFLFFVYMTFVNSSYEHPGRVIYYSKCASCHGDHGEGTQNLVPPIYNTSTLKNNFEALPSLILNGMKDSLLVEGKWYNQPMYPIQLSSVEMANLLNFMNDSFLVEKKVDFIINSAWVETQISKMSK